MSKYNVILADCAYGELLDLKDGVEDSTGEKWNVESSISNWGRTSKLSELRRYYRYFSEPLSVFLRRGKFKSIIGWQQFYALNYCFFCRIFNVKKQSIVLVTNFTYKHKKGIVGEIYHRYMKYIVSSKYVDSLLVLSKEYIKTCSEELGISTGKFQVIPFGVPDNYGKYESVTQGDYALAIGRSNRDYDWLIEEWKNIDLPLRIICDEFTYKGKLPDNVSIFDNVSGEKQYPQIMGSKIIIIPIKDESICSGDTVLLTALSFKKTVIVTAPSTLSEMYIIDGVNGFCVSKEHGSLAKCLEKACGVEREFGEKARESYLSSFSRYSMGKNIGNILNNYRVGQLV